MYTDPLQFTLGLVPSEKNLQFVLDSLNYSLCRRNATLEGEVAKTDKQREWWCILAQKVELECIVVEDLLENYDQVKEYLDK